MFYDNIGMIHLTVNPVLHPRTKHIEIDHHFVREKVIAGQLHVQHVPSEERLADPFTKGVSTQHFLAARPKLTVLPSPQ